MSNIIIDRFEGELAIVECNGDFFEIPQALLPKDSSEGDLLHISVSKPNNFSEAEAQLERLRERDTGEDIIDL